MSTNKLLWKTSDAKPVRFATVGFDPTLPVKIRRDKFDVGCSTDTLGILAPPAAAAARVAIIHGEYQRVCSSRELARQSLYCRRHLTRYPSPSKLLMPPSIPIEGLDAALQFMETTGIDVTIWNVAPILAAAVRLGIPDLQRRLEQYLKAVSKLNDSYFLQCWEICRRAPASVQTREEMLTKAAGKFENLFDEPEWRLINSHLVRRLFLRPEVKSLSPVTIFEAALAWITGNPTADPPNVDRVMAAVPFKRMQPIERMQCLAKAAEVQLTSVVTPRVAQSSWNQTCVEFDRSSQSDLPVTEAITVTTSEGAEKVLKLSPSVSTSRATELGMAQYSFEEWKKNKRSSATSDMEGGGSDLEAKGLDAMLTNGSPPIKIPEQHDRDERFKKRGRPVRLGYVTEASTTLPDGRRCNYRDEVVMVEASGRGLSDAQMNGN